MSERKPGTEESIPELRKPSVAGPYVPAAEVVGEKARAKQESAAQQTAEEKRRLTDEKLNVPSGSETSGQVGSADGGDPLGRSGDARQAEVEGRKEQGEAPVASQADRDREKEIEEAFAKRKGEGGGRSEGEGKGASSILRRDPDGKIRIEKLERTERRSQRAKAKVKLETVPAGAEEKEQKKGGGPFRYWVETVAVVAALLVVAAGVFIYLGMRETRVQVAITPGDIQLEPEAWVVYDFSDRIDFVKGDLERRREPFLQAIQETEANLSAARADLAGREARMRLLREALEQDQAEMPRIVEEQQAALRKLWDEEGPRLDREFEARQDQVNRAIAARAQQLGLRLEREEDLEAPEVIVNAFRLALYNAREGIDPTAERQWAEEQLKAWKEYEEAFAKRQDAIREKAVALRAEGAPKLEAVQERIEARQVEIGALAEEMKEFAEEVARHEKKRAELVEEMKGLAGPFVADLEKAPAEYIHVRWPIDHGWKIDVRRLEKDPNLPPGEYRLLLRGHRDGEPVWAFQNFVVEMFATTRIKVAESDFRPIRAWLEEGSRGP